jgi:hypothetical protein
MQTADSVTACASIRFGAWRKQGLKIRWPKGREGSNPSPGTNKFLQSTSFGLTKALGLTMTNQSP